MIEFRSIKTQNPGTIFQMLFDSYQDLIETYDPKNKNKYLESWHVSDELAFSHPDTIGKCVLFTDVNEQLVGFCSYDPRHFPEYGIIGQNCVLPKFKGQGYGRIQIQKLVEIFQEQKCTKALVSTGENDFFIPAQKMYQSFGFYETKRELNKRWGFNEIFYEKILS